MSYRVIYGRELPCEKAQKRSWLPIAAFAGVFAVAAFAHYFWADELLRLGQALFPWTRPEVKTALSSFVENIGQGTGVGNAVFAFCREILYASKAY